MGGGDGREKMCRPVSGFGLRLRLNCQEATWVAPPPPEMTMKSMTFAALLLALSAVNAAPVGQLGQPQAADSVMTATGGAAQERICLRCIR